MKIWTPKLYHSIFPGLGNKKRGGQMTSPFLLQTQMCSLLSNSASDVFFYADGAEPLSLCAYALRSASRKTCAVSSRGKDPPAAAYASGRGSLSPRCCPLPVFPILFTSLPSNCTSIPQCGCGRIYDSLYLVNRFRT